MDRIITPLIIFGAMLAYGGLHSALASLWAKARARRLLGARVADGTFRLVYNAVAVVTLLPPLALVAALSDGGPLWVLPVPVRYVTVPLQAAAALALIVSVWRVDVWRFAGLRQLGRLLAGEPEPREAPVLRTDGMHGWVRHPLYFFSLVVIWLAPVMTPNLLAFNLAATLYFWIGSIFEERKLVHDFGDAYRAHQARVPRLIPWPFRRR